MSEQQEADIDQEKAADERDDAKIGSSATQNAGHGLQQETRQQEGNAETQGIGRQHDGAAADRFGRGGRKQDRAQDRSDARRPASGKKDADQKGGEEAQGRIGLYMNALFGVKQGVEPLQSRQGHLAHDAVTPRRSRLDGAFDRGEEAHHVQTKQNDDDAADLLNGIHFLVEQLPYGAGRGAQEHENTGKPKHEEDRVQEGHVVIALRRARGGDRGAAEVCLLYTSDAADERSSVDLGGRRIIKKKKSA